MYWWNFIPYPFKLVDCEQEGSLVKQIFSSFYIYFLIMGFWPLRGQSREERESDGKGLSCKTQCNQVLAYSGHDKCLKLRDFPIDSCNTSSTSLAHLGHPALTFHTWSTVSNPSDRSIPSQELVRKPSHMDYNEINFATTWGSLGKDISLDESSDEYASDRHLDFSFVRL